MSAAAKEYTPDFLAFWDRYPRHSGCSKAEAFKSYDRVLARQIANAAEIMAGLLAYPFNAEVRYQPHAATWLNQRRWEGQDGDRAPPTTIAAPESRTAWRDRYDPGEVPYRSFPAQRQDAIAPEPFTVEGHLADD